MSLHTSTKVVVYIGGHLCLFSVTAAAKHFFQLFRTHLHFSSSQVCAEAQEGEAAVRLARGRGRARAQ